MVNAGQDIHTEMLSVAGFVSFGIQKAMYHVVNYLVSNKRTKIAFFGAHDETHSDQVKIDEFLKLCSHMQLPLGTADVYKDLTVADCAKSFELNMHRYNAVICSSDAAAVYLLKWLEVSAVKYRIKKMLTAGDFKNKEELAEVVRKYNIV